MDASRVDSGSIGRTRRRTLRLIVVVGCSIAIAWVSGCATTGLKQGSDGRYRHRDLDYEIDAPGLPPEAGWRMIKLDDTDLAWRTDDGRSMSLSSSCKRTRAKPALLARRLLIGVPKDAVIAAHPVALRGDAGWAQIVETGTGARAVRIKTVTVVSRGCVFDWVLVAGAGPRFDDSVSAFDAWWTSFERTGEGPDSEPVADVEPASEPEPAAGVAPAEAADDGGGAS